MKLLTFLGVGKYEETMYEWQGQKCLTPFSPVATCHFLNPDSVTVFLTEEAEQNVYDRFKSQLPAHVQLFPVAVPMGKNETELWSIFASVSQVVKPGDEVAFDITNGLRSFPLIGLLVSAFLKFGLDVKLKGVLYGAFDVRDKNVTPNVTPMFDLTPMLMMLEWSAAADRFNRTGDSRYLASLLKQEKNILANAAQKDPERLRELSNLSNLGENLSRISQSLNLIRPVYSLEEVARLPGYVERATPILRETATAQPFMLVMDQIQKTYEPIGLDHPLDDANIPAFLEKQRMLIRWYVDREHWVQAVTLSREWLISWLMVQMDETDITNRDIRKDYENRINDENNTRKTTSGIMTPIMQNYSCGADFLSLWSTIVEKRNDIDHAGMNPDPNQAQILIKNIEKIVLKIESLPLQAVSKS